MNQPLSPLRHLEAVDLSLGLVGGIAGLAVLSSIEAARTDRGAYLMLLLLLLPLIAFVCLKLHQQRAGRALTWLYVSLHSLVFFYIAAGLIRSKPALWLGAPLIALGLASVASVTARSGPNARPIPATPQKTAFLTVAALVLGWLWWMFALK